MGERRRFAGAAVGGSSLLTIFGILCLMVFALLSLSTVLSDQRLSEKTMAQVAEYYAADVMAEEILSRLRQGELPDGVERDGMVYSYSCPISETQDLIVEVILENDTWDILRWQAVPVQYERTKES